MPVYQVASKNYVQTVLAGDGTDQTAFVASEQSLNPLTGNIGINTVRFANLSTSNWVALIWCIGWVAWIWIQSL